MVWEPGGSLRNEITHPSRGGSFAQRSGSATSRGSATTTCGLLPSLRCSPSLLYQPNTDGPNPPGTRHDPGVRDGVPTGAVFPSTGRCIIPTGRAKPVDPLHRTAHRNGVVALVGSRGDSYRYHTGRVDHKTDLIRNRGPRRASRHRTSHPGPLQTEGARPDGRNLPQRGCVQPAEVQSFLRVPVC